MNRVYDVAGIVIGPTGRVELSDQELIALERRTGDLKAGGYIASSSAEFSMPSDLVNAGCVNVPNCSGTTNRNGCTNVVVCDGSTNWPKCMIP